MLAALILCALTARMAAQDDGNDVPLGDVARNLRKTGPNPQQVIDDDNLSNVMRQADTRHATSSGLRYVMGGGDKDFRVSAPDVTCSLAFTANAKSLLSSQYAQMELPPADLSKLQGPAAIEGDALTVSLFNATGWHVSEIAVAMTIVNKSAGFSPAPGSQGAESAVRPEKKPDATFIYRMRAAASPWATTTFNAPLNGDLAPGQEWHWAIVQAKGYPPLSNPGAAPQTATVQPLPKSDSRTAEPGVPPLSSPLSPSSPPALPQNPQ
jgi:hypothetical protein